MYKQVFLFIATGLISVGATAQSANQPSINDLEQRIEALELKVQYSLKGCQLKFKSTGIFHNYCPANTVASEVLPITDRVLQLRCGYYQLQCERQH